jgi:CheY-like chemotaxis protein
VAAQPFVALVRVQDMTFNILVAEPSNDLWTSIVNGLRRHRPDAEILRVKDGEQAIRLLFRQGLLTDAPETPDLVVLAADLPLLPVNAVIDRIRQHPRTLGVPVILVWPDGGRDDLDDDPEDPHWLHQQPDIVVIAGTHKLEKEVANAVIQLKTNR